MKRVHNLFPRLTAQRKMLSTVWKRVYKGRASDFVAVSNVRDNITCLIVGLATIITYIKVYSSLRVANKQNILHN